LSGSAKQGIDKKSQRQNNGHNNHDLNEGKARISVIGHWVSQPSAFNLYLAFGLQPSTYIYSAYLSISLTFELISVIFHISTSSLGHLCPSGLQTSIFHGS
jgi:hypothetical protein